MMKKMVAMALFALSAAVTFGEVVDVTALVRTDGTTDGTTYFNTTGSSSGAQTYQKPETLFNGNNTGDRYYLTRPTVCYNLESAWRSDKDVVLKKYVIYVAGGSYTDRIPCQWTLKGSIDDGATYTVLIDSRAITMESSEIAAGTSCYVITVELPENAVASRFFKFEFTKSMTNKGADGNGAITMGEIKLWGELKDRVYEIAYDISSVTNTYDGLSHAVKINAVYPADTTIEYADAEEGDYSTTPITRTEVGESTVWLRLSCEGYETAKTSRQIVITNGVVNLTKQIREGEAADGETYHVLTESGAIRGVVANLFDGRMAGDDDRWYNGTWFTYSVSDDYLTGNQMTLKRYVLKDAVNSSFASVRFPTGWDLYGSLDGETYDILLDSKRGLTLDDFPNVGGAYTYVGDLSGNKVPYRHYKFVFNSTNPVNLNEVELHTQIESERNSIIYEKRDKHVVYSGIPVTIGVNVSSPAEGVTVEYALSEEGPWSADAPTFTEVMPETPVWFRLSAEGYDTTVDSATVTIDPLTKETVDVTAVLRQARVDTGTSVYSVTGTVGIAVVGGTPSYPEKLFDGITGDDANDRWYITTLGAFAVYSITNAYAPGRSVVVSNYEFVVGNNWQNRRPQAWTLYGSRDGVNFTAVDHIEDADWGESKTYSRDLPEPKRYRHYKVVFERLGTDGAISMMEIRFRGAIGDKPGLILLVR